MKPEDQMRKLLRTEQPTELAPESEWEEFRGQAHRSVAIRRTLIAGGLAALVALGVAGASTLAPRSVSDPQPQPPAGGEGTDRPTIEPSRVEPSDVKGSRPVSELYPSTHTDPSQVVQVWFVTSSSEPRLSWTYRDIGDTEGVARAAIESLLAGPTGPDMEAGDISAIPEDTELLGLTIEDGAATIDLSQEFEDTNLGSRYAHFPIAQVVWTLTQFPTVDSVIFEIEGRRIDTYGNHGLVISGPQSRKHYEDSAPPIVVDFPFPGQIVGSTFTLEGSANVFEANVSYRVVRGRNEILAEGFTTATCGTGCRGEFEETIDLEVTEDTHAWLEVFESSAEDGSPLHMVRFPINIAP